MPEPEPYWNAGTHDASVCSSQGQPDSSYTKPPQPPFIVESDLGRIQSEWVAAHQLIPATICVYTYDAMTEQETSAPSLSLPPECQEMAIELTLLEAALIWARAPMS